MRLPIYVWIVVLFVFASLGIVGAFVYQNNARKAEAERRAAAVAEAERQTAQAAAEQREREEREAKDRQTKADEAERAKARAKADAEARAKRVADEAKRKYDLMSDLQRRLIDEYREAVRKFGDDAPANVHFHHPLTGNFKWFLIENSDQFAGHNIVAAMCRIADKRDVAFLVTHQKPSDRATIRMKLSYFDLSVGEIDMIRRIVQDADKHGVGALESSVREYIRDHPALFPAWAK